MTQDIWCLSNSAEELLYKRQNETRKRNVTVYIVSFFFIKSGEDHLKE